MKKFAFNYTSRGSLSVLIKDVIIVCIIRSDYYDCTILLLFYIQNPLNDGVCTRCIEVFSKHNLTLQVLDLNETNISMAALKNVKKIQSLPFILSYLSLHSSWRS